MIRSPTPLAHMISIAVVMMLIGTKRPHKQESCLLVEVNFLTPELSWRAMEERICYDRNLTWALLLKKLLMFVPLHG